MASTSRLGLRGDCLIGHSTCHHPVGRTSASEEGNACAIIFFIPRSLGPPGRSSPQPPVGGHPPVGGCHLFLPCSIPLIRWAPSVGGCLLFTPIRIGGCLLITQFNKAAAGIDSLPAGRCLESPFSDRSPQSLPRLRLGALARTSHRPPQKMGATYSLSTQFPIPKR